MDDNFCYHHYCQYNSRYMKNIPVIYENHNLHLSTTSSSATIIITSVTHHQQPRPLSKYLPLLSTQQHHDWRKKHRVRVRLEKTVSRCCCCRRVQYLTGSQTVHLSSFHFHLPSPRIYACLLIHCA